MNPTSKTEAVTLATDLATAVAGQLVAHISRGFYDRVQRLKKIDRCTKAMIFIGAERFHRDNGREVGGCGYSRSSIHVVSVDEAKKIAHYARVHDARCDCKNTKWDSIDEATVLACAKLLKEAPHA